MTFKKVIEDHEREKERKREELDRKVEALHEADKKFRSEFESAVNEVAKPIFEKFVDEVREAGYIADMAAAVDGTGNPYVEIRFLPEAIAEPNASDYAVFVLKGNASNQQVEHNLHYDQRTGGDDGTKKKSFGISSIRRETLERHLSVFLKQALERS